MAKKIYAICTKCKKKSFKHFGNKTFCSNCGAELPEVEEYEKCKYCGNDIVSECKFCSGCGKETINK